MLQLDPELDSGSESAWFQRLKFKYDKQASSIAFNLLSICLRRPYTMVGEHAAPAVAPLRRNAHDSLWRLLATHSHSFDLGGAVQVDPGLTLLGFNART